MENFPSIHFLRYFYCAGKHLNMSKAAEENFVTQSAISQGIRKLEIELGVELLSNRKNKLELTADGELLLDKCDAIFSLFSEVNDLLNEKADLYRGKFRFATNHSFALSLIPKFYKTLLKKHPLVEPKLQLGHAGIVRNWVKTGEVEFGIILASDEDYALFKTQVIFKGKHGLFEPKKKVKDSLNRLIISEDSREDHILLNFLREKCSPLPPIVEVLSWEVIARMVEQGLGVGMLPNYVANRYGFKPASLKIPPVNYTVIAISSRKKKLSRNARLFIDLMKEDEES